MANYLLIGAGFSRNWGGWLATEAFEYLLGCPEITQNSNLRELLWRHQPQGGFESALAELQVEFYRNPQAVEPTLHYLQNAISNMFRDMNSGLIERKIWEFQGNIDRQITPFLTRFDAIFSLNQDLLLEHYYTNDNISLIGKRKWNGAQLPGMRLVRNNEALDNSSWSQSTWHPEKEEAFKIDKNSQPIFKLHGSSNWSHADGRPMLIMGGAKAHSIEQTPILKWYADNFEEKLTQQPSKLMIIGYGFRDDHINASISKAIALGLKIFIISPEGAGLARSLNNTRGRNAIEAKEPLEEMFEAALIGASRRSLREIFGDDLAEYKKIIRFFDN